MVFQHADVTLTNNTIIGSGIAGLRVAGRVRADNNRFIGVSVQEGAPPNVAVWALPGSQVALTDNEVRGWRHGLHARESDVSALRNSIHDFQQVAIVIQGTTSPANVFGNTAYSEDTKAEVISLTGEAGLVIDNELMAPPQTLESEK